MRQSVYQRKTGETDIAVSFNLDGTGTVSYTHLFKALAVLRKSAPIGRGA